jgi:hypothetical protein
VESGSGAAQGQAKSLDTHYQREDLVSAVREFFYHVEYRRAPTGAYRIFARRHACVGDTLITFNYDVALERALMAEEKWDIGSGYGFRLFPDRPPSPLTVFKLHGSVNWFRFPLQQIPPPLVFERDLKLLGYEGISDARIGANGCAVGNRSTLVLPEPDKPFYWKELWVPLWESAAKRLRSARRVFIHGYSLPSGDARARRLFFDNVIRRASVYVFCKGDSKRIAGEFRNRGFSDVRHSSEVGFEDWSSRSAIERF